MRNHPSGLPELSAFSHRPATLGSAAREATDGSNSAELIAAAHNPDCNAVLLIETLFFRFIPTRGLARILTLGRCIGALSESKLLCNNDLASLGGSPRCRRSVAQTYLVLHPLTAVGWRRVSTAGR